MVRRRRAAPGNHEYESPNASPYYEYFGAAAGPTGAGYYSYELGAWHIIVLNSNVRADVGSAQYFWLRQDLDAHDDLCTLAYWHHPLFSAGPNGNSVFMRDIWRLLYDRDTEVVISAHDHMYEQFAPQDANGRFDQLRGIRGFVVGTGGAPLYDLVFGQPNLVTWSSTHGVLKMTLTSTGYSWEFLPVAGSSYRDAGSGTCH